MKKILYFFIPVIICLWLISCGNQETNRILTYNDLSIETLKPMINSERTDIFVKFYLKNEKLSKIVFLNHEKKIIKSDTIIRSNNQEYLLDSTFIQAKSIKLKLFKVSFIQNGVFFRHYLIYHNKMVYLCAILKQTNSTTFERRNINNNIYSYGFTNINEYCHSLIAELNSKYLFLDFHYYEFPDVNNPCFYFNKHKYKWGVISDASITKPDKCYKILYLNIDHFDEVEAISPGWSHFPPPILDRKGGLRPTWLY